MKYKPQIILKKIFISIFFLTTFSGSEILSSLNKEVKLSETNVLEKYVEFDYKNEDYLLGYGDVLSIRLSKSITELEQIYIIDGKGLINLPEIERIYVKGLTINELEKVLNIKYKNILKNPDIEILILDYRPINVYLLGEVEEPGMYSFLGSSFNQFNYSDDNSIKRDSISGTFDESENESFNAIRKIKNDGQLKAGYNRSYFPTIFDVLRKAGGVTNYSDLTNVKVIRDETLTNGGGKKQAYINFLDVIEKGDFSKNLRIYDNDTIIISKSETEILGQLSKAVKSNLNPKYIRVFVSGRISSKPGVVSIPKSSTLSDAIEIAGGSKLIRGKTTFIRYKTDGSLDKRLVSPKRAKRGSNNNPYLKSGDIIRVGKGPLGTVTEVLNEITAPLAGGYTLYSITNDILD